MGVAMPETDRLYRQLIEMDAVARKT
jgi:hypothetical protein